MPISKALAVQERKMDIRRYVPINMRPCKYGLALQGDSVFADFGLSKEGSLFLIRISFDGHGCCEPKRKLPIMETVKSKYLISAIERTISIY